MHSEGCLWPRRLLEVALKHGYCELARWRYERGAPPFAFGAFLHAAESGSVPLLAWLLQLPDTEMSRFDSHAAVYYGHVDQLRWLMDNGCP